MAAVKLRHVALIMGLILLVPSHGAQRRKRGPRYDCSVRVNKAIKAFERKRYNEVRTILEDVHYQCAGHSVIDTAFYYLGMALLRNKSPIESKTQFERLIQNFPNSGYNEEAHFRLGHCSFLESNPYDRDQTKTHEAVRELTDFVDMFPGSPFADSAKTYLDRCRDKLARKEYESARFYERIGEYEAAIIYFKAVIDEFPRSAYVPESKLLMARALLKVNRTIEAREVIDDILGGSYSDEIVHKAKALRDNLRRSD
jgi:outer membrane protein assembly factor BamD